VIAAVRNNGFSFPYQNIKRQSGACRYQEGRLGLRSPSGRRHTSALGFLNLRDLSDFLLVGELSLDESETGSDVGEDELPRLAALSGASIAGRLALGPKVCLYLLDRETLPELFFPLDRRANERGKRPDQ
jgi:hypothetical protein